MPIFKMTRQAVSALAYFTKQGIEQDLEPVRSAQAGWALLASGCSPAATFPGHTLAQHLVATQQDDGGWADVEETLWCLGYLSAFGSQYSSEMARGKMWLTSARLPCGAWGRTGRDRPRIPITSLVSVLTPGVADKAALLWLAEAWKKDLSSPVQLTYKGGFFLLSQGHPEAPKAPDLVRDTLAYLAQEQDEQGGFGPWKGHPVGSDPWSTGVVLWGLSRLTTAVPDKIVARAISWLQTKQLSNGLWPYHYLDEGATMALIGISSILRSRMGR